MASIRDVAKLAGVSITSISRVINNDKTFTISEDKRKKIYEAIEELNYKVPENYGKTGGSKNSIGCIQRLTIEGTKDNYFSTISSGIKQHLSKYGKSLNFMLTQFDFENNDYKNIFQSYPKGLIIMGDISPEAFEFLKTKINYIVGVDTAYKDIDNIRYNRFEAGVMAVDHLIKNGHKKIGYIGSNINMDDLANIGRFEAYLRVLRKNNLDIRQDWIIDSKWHRETCFKETIKLLQSEDRPTAIFVASDHMAIAAISAINSLGLKVPDDISIVAISDITESAYLNPPLTTVSIPQKEMGKLASETLLHRINGDATIIKEIYVPCKLIVRNSVKKL